MKIKPPTETNKKESDGAMEKLKTSHIILRQVVFPKEERKFKYVCRNITLSEILESLKLNK